MPGILSKLQLKQPQKAFTVETNPNNLATEFKAPTVPADFKTMKKTGKMIPADPANLESDLVEEEVEETLPEIRHVYPNGKMVIFLLLSDGRVVCVRTGNGEDVEAATMESGGQRASYLTALMARCTKIDGADVTMFDLKAASIKDYTAIQMAFAEINF